VRTFKAQQVPPDPAALPQSVARIQLAIEQAAHRPQPFLEVETLHAEPERVREGMVVLADGTDWNPGSGAGFYGYYGSAWVKLG
jgi:hypothetical protein